MVSFRAGFASCSAGPASKQHAFVAAADTVTRLHRVRQRPWSSPPQQQAPAAAASRSPFSTRHRNQQLLGTTASYHSNSSDVATIRGRFDAGPMRVSRRGRSKSSGSTSRSSNGIGAGIRGPNLNTCRNRMMAAAKRRRWREVSCAPTEKGIIKTCVRCVYVWVRGREGGRYYKITLRLIYDDTYGTI